MSLNRKTARDQVTPEIGKSPIKKQRVSVPEEVIINSAFNSQGLIRTTCSICQRDISLQIKIICGECPETFIYCVNCLVGQKHPGHNYHIVDKMNFPLFTPDWSMTDEIKLVSSVEKFGLDNWVDISENMVNRGKVECESHYYTFYINPLCLPNSTDIILKSIEKDGKYVFNEEVLNRNLSREKVLKEEYTLNQGKAPEQSLNDKNAKNNGRSVVRNNKTKVEVSTIKSAGEILGYWPKREEFDNEFLNDAELEIAELEFLDEDTENDKKLKMEVLQTYNAQLNERRLRKEFIIKKNLLDLKRQNNFECKLSKEDREILNFLKPFARFYEYSEFFELYEGIVLEKNLKHKLSQLRMYQKQGLKTVEDLQRYLEIDNIKSRKKDELAGLPQTPEKNMLGERVKRFLNYNTNRERHEQEMSASDREFVKEMMLPRSTFYDIKKEIGRKTDKESVNNILSKYDIEKKTNEEIFEYFTKDKSNK